jgi:hypothetical protein
VRFSEEVAARLKHVSDQSGIPVAQLIRIATEGYLERIQKTGKIEIDVPCAQYSSRVALNEERTVKYTKGSPRPHPLPFNSISPEEAAISAAAAERALAGEKKGSSPSSGVGGPSANKPAPSRDTSPVPRNKKLPPVQALK